MRFNPFPGLRPFESDEDHLFFGREPDIDALLARLRTSRFVAVVGTSGSGKSSLVRSGLIPSLLSGVMAGAGSSWRVAVLRPGEDPIGHLAEAASHTDVLGTDEQLGDTRRVLIEATLRRGTLGLVNAVRQARIPADHNVLVVVDQFEEIFRYRRGRAPNSRDESIAFVRLLLEAAAQQDLPIYVVVTMRSDFIGDCMDFPGLPDAINAGLYLVGRMSRDALRSAITGPVAVAGGTIAPRLVSRVLNDLGDDHDQLPRAQHVLMRTCEHWTAHGTGGVAVDIADYEAVGTFRDALSQHAEEAWREAISVVDESVVERVFKALTDTHSDPRGVRRPTTVDELTEICGAPEADVIGAVDVFRRPGRCFLTPPSGRPLTGRSIIDISHESLMRCWTRLIGWAEQERVAAEFYLRLSRDAGWFEAGKAGLWRHPELGLGERWRAETRPTAAWARRCDDHYDRAIAFLDRSLTEHRRQTAEAERLRRATLRRTQWTAALLATLLVIAASLAVVARNASTRASANFTLAHAAVDESLSSVDLDPARLGADVPALEELRRDLLTKAQHFYVAFSAQAPDSEQARHDLALARLRLGHINRLLRRPDEAAREYADAITRFEQLVGSMPGASAYREGLADANNWLGETYRPQTARLADAERVYGRALQLQLALLDADPANAALVRQLARTYYNRGILLAGQPDTAARSEDDLRNAVTRLEPIAAVDAGAAQELARAYNNLAALLAMGGTRAGEARALYEHAVAIAERLVREVPDSREYKLELAKFCNNLAALLSDAGERAGADARSRQAVQLLDTLARLAPALAIERADARTLRGQILASGDGAAGEREYAESLAMFEDMLADERLRGLPDFHQRFADLLLNLSVFPADTPGSDAARRLLDRAVARYAELARMIAAGGSPDEVRLVFDSVSGLLPTLPSAARAPLAAAQERLRRSLPAGK